MKKYIILLAVATVAVSSCKKSFLDETVYSKFTAETLKDSLDFEAGVIGIQSQYNLWNNQNENMNGNQGFLCVWQMGTDIAYNKAPDDLDPMSIPYTNYEKLTSADVSVDFTWKWSYNIINNANNVIANIEKTKTVLSSGFRDRIKGQAMFYRGLAYNYLATIFGGVP